MHNTKINLMLNNEDKVNFFKYTTGLFSCFSLSLQRKRSSSGRPCLICPSVWSKARCFTYEFMWLRAELYFYGIGI